MKRKYLYLAGAGVALWLLLRKLGAAAAAAAPSSGLVDFSPIGIGTIYFDSGETFDINANVNSPTFGQQITRS